MHMLPYISSEIFHLGPIPFRTWGTLVAAGFLVGTYISAQRAKAKGLDPKHIWDLAFWMFIASFIGARLFHVLFYEPAYYLQHPLEALNPLTPGYALYGSFIASALVLWWYVKKHKLDFIEYADTVVWGLPWGCGIGRIGCFLIHDHPGTLSHSLLAVKYPDGQVRHDLGLYLSLVGFIIGGIFLWLNRKPRASGFWLGMYLALDSASRIWLDFYRIVDVKYFGLTPTQWVSIPVCGFGVWLIWSRRKPLSSS